LEGLRVLGIRQQGSFGQGSAKPIGLSQAEVRRGQGHQQLSVQLGEGRLQLTWLPHLRVQQRLDGAQIRFLLSGIVQPPGAPHISLHLSQEQPGLGERIKFPDANQLYQIGLAVLT
jgi:hypothetical protein